MVSEQFAMLFFLNGTDPGKSQYLNKILDFGPLCSVQQLNEWDDEGRKHKVNR